ncbi:hypothetical protein [Aureispira anguillae]|nr:hypothetical protein [Aureispira anguillae]
MSKENLTLDTIAKIEQVLSIELLDTKVQVEIEKELEYHSVQSKRTAFKILPLESIVVSENTLGYSSYKIRRNG